MRQRKLQSTIEFLTTYAWALTIIVIFVAFVIVLVGFRNPSSFTPASCYITTTLPCQEALFEVNSSRLDSYYIMIFSNDFGTPIAFPDNAVSLHVGFSTSSYIGNCLPANVPNGGTVVCNVTLSGFVPDVGTQADTTFNVSYMICDASGCPPTVYSTSGYTTGTVSPYKNVLSQVLLGTSSGMGYVALDGIRYPSGAEVPMVNGVAYQIAAVPAQGQYFASWSGSSGIVVANALSQSTSVTVSQQGSLTANTP